MKSATLGFLGYKSCSSVPRLDSCRGKRIVTISQAGSWADGDTVSRSEPDHQWMHYWFTWGVQASKMFCLTRQIWSEVV